MRPAAGHELAFTFPCRGAMLVGIVHTSVEHADRGVLIIVGGPQYRVGSHRQFVLLARDLASQGVPVMRFDHRGIGDGDEPYVGFEGLSADIEAAVNTFMKQCPGLREVVLWGLCDAASAILFYAHQDPRVAGIVLLNPWARTPESEARTYLRHYYLKRLTNGDFWRRLVLGRLGLRKSILSLLTTVARSRGYDQPTSSINADSGVPDADLLPERMAKGFAKFKGPVLLIMSGQDLTAREFDALARTSKTWPRLLAMPTVSRRDLEAADHTFSSRAWRDQVAKWTSEWIRSISKAGSP